jgi:Flp pilus assembly protein TadD
VHSQYGYWCLRPQGRFDDARQHYRIALEHDPVGGFARISDAYLFEGKFEDSLEASRKVLECDPNYWPSLSMAAAALAFMGHAEESRQWIAKARAIGPELAIGVIDAILAAVRGDKALAEEVAAQLETLEGWRRMPGMLAIIYGALGDLDRAFREAERMIDLRTARALWIISPAHRALRQHPRFPELLQRMRLPAMPGGAGFSLQGASAPASN